MNAVLVFVGGGLGAALRYGMNIGIGRANPTEFPLHTLLINISGCFVMGFLTALMALKLNISNEMRLFLTTGILGGFTTFSAFALDFAVLFERRDFTGAALYAAASVIISILACFAGLALARAIAA
ncbi:fluoride efflux transporter CrcB [Aestuariivirga litoralis]|uniref:fluoride efflux transporter CrcB n=1 Tax=Aestuariivirga litoralis TaxID=2650924 RepID=UPI0018C612D1|nr:fluoride efflux transporter CrcB [Aestuariivirga litoralis]MBG1231703.1 fluoride efflux transporter CrcB [Aestuariivirga litoralis]